MEETIISFLRVLGAVPFLLPVFPVFLYSVVCDFGAGRVQSSTVQGSAVQSSKAPCLAVFPSGWMGVGLGNPGQRAARNPK